MRRGWIVIRDNTGARGQDVCFAASRFSSACATRPSATKRSHELPARDALLNQQLGPLLARARDVAAPRAGRESARTLSVTDAYRRLPSENHHPRTQDVQTPSFAFVFQAVLLHREEATTPRSSRLRRAPTRGSAPPHLRSTPGELRGREGVGGRSPLKRVDIKRQVFVVRPTFGNQKARTS